MPETGYQECGLNPKWLRGENIMSLPEALCRGVKTNPQKTAIDYILKFHPVKIGKIVRFNLAIGKKISYEELGESSRRFPELFIAYLFAYCEIKSYNFTNFHRMKFKNIINSGFLGIGFN